MLDFTTAGTIELSHAILVERKELRDSRKWHRALRELDREDGGYVASPRRRRELHRDFVSALDEAHAAGMTIDAWMQRGSRILVDTYDPDAELNARADWAGLNDAA